MTKDQRRLLENVAAISADVHTDRRLQDRKDSSFFERLEWVLEAAIELTRLEPDDYEREGLDWYETTEQLADAYYEDQDAKQAARAVLTPAEGTVNR